MKYATILLDCDGVVLDSNQIKTTAFRQTLDKYEESIVDEFIAYHKTNGGVSRFKKYKYFLKNLAKNYSDKEYNKLLNQFQKLTIAGLIGCNTTIGVLDFVTRYKFIHD